MEPDPLSLFFGNDKDVLAAVKASCSLRRFDNGATLLAEEEEDNEVFLLLEGKVRAIVLSAEGHEIWLDDFGPGEIFGEMAALGGFERTSNIIAVTDVTVAIFPAKKFLGLMKRHGSIGLAVSKILVQRMRSTTRRMFELSALSAPGRIYAELLRLSKPYEEVGGEKRIISPAPVLSVFAGRVNSTRETVSRAINDLEKRGLIIREGKALIIITPRKLSGLIS
ncbi:MAG: Crp/Fnr family transcriptional regulator [Proteobacteria bacterium]|nr:Crp/Fnr family transcriptional regulator [Pseudomonadota bacterium]